VLPLLVSIGGGAHSSAISLGADLSDCRSSLRVGPVQCETVPTATNAALLHGEMNVPPTSGKSGEDAIEAFLANYGKPPREAVRALLDPTDENIRALLRKREETIAVASYLAERMSEIRQLESASDGPAASRLTDSSLMGLRITLFERPGQDKVESTLDAMRALADDFPLLKLQVGLVGNETARELRSLVSRLPPSLTAKFVRPEECNSSVLPFIRIEDLRTGKAAEFDATDADRDTLQRVIAGLRRPRAQRPAAPTLQDDGADSP
jgi:hypothetical protein